MAAKNELLNVQWAGVDEAGRGPLAGPVIAAAVVLPEHYELPGLKDSKKLSAAHRERLARFIREQALGWALGRAEVEEIDRLNILQASLLAMQRAVAGLPLKPWGILVDGNRAPPIAGRLCTVVRGDCYVPVISAASILAKTARDHEMEVLDACYPHYQFARHKGYPTAVHRQLLALHGPSSVHRRSFAPVRKLLESTR